MAVAAQGMAKTAELLSKRFTLIATNVPYLGRGKQDDELKYFIDEEYSDAKSDIAVAFLLRMQKSSQQWEGQFLRYRRKVGCIWDSL